MLYTTLYLNKDPSGDPSLATCRTAFFPWPECDGVGGWDVLEYQTEQKMWEEVAFFLPCKFTLILCDLRLTLLHSFYQVSHQVFTTMVGHISLGVM